MPRYAPMVAPLVQWRPIHDQIITLHIAGYGPDAIVETLGKCRSTVIKTIKDPRGQRIFEIARKRAFSKVMENVEDRMAVLGVRAVDNIAQTINEQVIDSEGKPAIGTKAKIHQDNISFELLSRIGFGRSQTQAEGGVLKFSPETEKKLVDGLKKARKAEIEFKEAEIVVEEVTSGENGTEPGS